MSRILDERDKKTIESNITATAAAINKTIDNLDAYVKAEDTDIRKEDLICDFNPSVALLVDGVTKLAKMNFSSKEDENLAMQANSLISMFSNVLGFTFKSQEVAEVSSEESNNDSEKLLALIGEIRDKLRADKNYALSDYIRDELNKLNINISDKKI